MQLTRRQSDLKRGFFTKALDIDELRNLYELAFVLLKFGLETVGPSDAVSDIAARYPFDGTALSGLKGDHKGQAQICAAIVEDLFEAIVALSSNSTMRHIIATFNEKIVSDGFFRLVNVFGAYDAADLVANALRGGGLRALCTELRSREADDPSCRTYPRLTRMDDASAILVRIQS